MGYYRRWMRALPESFAGGPSSVGSRPRDRGRGSGRALRATLCAGLAALVSFAFAGPGTAARALGSPAAGAPATVYEGRQLAEVLRALEAQGLTIVFTSELVRPG
ncbi:MAG TPA: hypothetical protein VJG13_10460, partial [Thermoanaerobaculia bacterium]|nr:hypothetical protein [Thermoanaerobaculia bacterium]